MHVKSTKNLSSRLRKNKIVIIYLNQTDNILLFISSNYSGFLMSKQKPDT